MSLLTDQQTISGTVEEPEDATLGSTVYSASTEPSSPPENLPVAADIGATTIEASLLRASVMLHVSVGVYSGVVSQDDEDLKVQGVQTNQDADRFVFMPGHKRLIRKEALAPFIEWRNRIKGYLGGVSVPFAKMDGQRLVKRTLIREVLDKLEEFKNELVGLVDTFIGLDGGNYIAEQNMQAGIFDQRYPDRAGYLTQFFLTPDQVRRKFGLEWDIFQMSEVSDAEAANLRAEEAQSIHQRAASQGEEMIQNIRKLMQSRLVVIAKALNVKGKINGDRVHELTEDMIQKFQSLSFADDAKTQELLNSVREHVGNVKNWKTDAEAKAELSKVIAEGEALLKKEIEENEIIVTRANDRRVGAAITEEDLESAEGSEDLAPVESVRRVARGGSEAEDDSGEIEEFADVPSRVSRAVPITQPQLETVAAGQ